MKSSKVRSGIAVGFAGFIAIIIISVVAYSSWIDNLIKNSAPAVRPAARAVLKTYYLSKITGDYWENELAEQARTVALLKRAERLDFYRAILVNCELETTKAMVFSQNVQPDAMPLRNDLINRMRAGEFSDPREKRRVNAWIIKLKVIYEIGNENLFGQSTTRLLNDEI